MIKNFKTSKHCPFYYSILRTFAWGAHIRYTHTHTHITYVFVFFSSLCFVVSDSSSFCVYFRWCDMYGWLYVKEKKKKTVENSWQWRQPMCSLRYKIHYDQWISDEIQVHLKCIEYLNARDSMCDLSVLLNQLWGIVIVYATGFVFSSLSSIYLAVSLYIFYCQPTPLLLTYKKKKSGSMRCATLRKPCLNGNRHQNYLIILSA